MGREWIKQVTQDRQAREALLQTNVELMHIGKTQASNLFRMLKDEVSASVDEFNRDNGRGQRLIEFGFQPSNKFVVRHSSFPVITLTVTLEEGGSVNYKRQEKKSSTAEHIVAEEGVIFIMAGSNVDQAYYSIEGKDYREQDCVAELLLKPIFLAVP